MEDNDQPLSTEPAAPAADPAIDPYGIVVGLWQDQPHFSCPECPYDSLYREKVEEHIDSRHRHPLPPSVLFDADGNKL